MRCRGVGLDLGRAGDGPETSFPVATFPLALSRRAVWQAAPKASAKDQPRNYQGLGAEPPFTVYGGSKGPGTSGDPPGASPASCE